MSANYDVNCDDMCKLEYPMKYIIVLFVFLFCSVSSAIAETHSKKQSAEIGPFDMEGVIREHIRYRSTGNSFSVGKQELYVMHIFPMRFYTSSCPKEYQKSYHLYKEWLTQYQPHSCRNSRCRNEVINGIGKAPAQCWNILNKYGHSMEWLQQTVKGHNQEGKNLYNQCPDGCSFYTTIVRYYTGECEKEVSKVLVYCGHKKSVSLWNVESYIIDSAEQQPASLIQTVFDNFVSYF